MTDLIIPEGVTKIGDYAFYGCSGITSVTVPNSVTTIGNYAFSHCTNLNKIYWNVQNAEIPIAQLPTNIDSLIIGEKAEEVGFSSRPPFYFEFRNPFTKVRMYASPKETSFCDYNHDGTMEFIDTVVYKVSSTTYRNMRFKNLYGFSVSDDLLDAAYTDLQTINLNNDTLIDFITGSTLYQANDQGGYDKSELDYSTSNSNGNHLFALDADLNGTTDFYSYEDGAHYLHLRQFDGTYLKTELNIIEEQAEIDSALYAYWDKPKTGMEAIIIVEDHLPHLSDSWMIGNTTIPDNYKSIDVAIDLDKNGLVDLLSSSTGAVLYNLGNNKFLKGQFPGAVTVKDMNNDGIEDFVIYDESAKTVSLQIYESSGSYSTIPLMQNMNISNVWCYDFDNDGDIDILLPFDWTSTSGYAYLVFWRNDGNNTFKKVETAFDDPIKHFQFLDCRDVDNDGRYEIIARDSIYGKDMSFKNGNYYLIRYNNRLKATMDATPFAANTVSSADTNLPFIYGDFDNDGNNECYYYSHYYKNGKNTDYVVLSRFANTTLNTPPQKMSKPRVAGDEEAGKILVSWDQGSDAESPNIDLVYSMRIGSAPGLSDMWYASALNNGKQTSLNAANAGAHLSQIVNLAGWKAGDYYIAVQAIDPNGLGGAWSDEVVYHHALPSAMFNTDKKEISTMDTIRIHYAGIVDNSATYNWNFGDSATIITSDAAKQVYEIAYNSAGTKTISLQVATTDGRTSSAYSVEIRVYPMRLDKVIAYADNSNYMAYFDMDMDGRMDALGYYYLNGTQQQGFFKGKADGSFMKLAKTYNSDLTIDNIMSLSDSCIFADFNMDGLPDVQWSTSKGTTMYNREDFDMDFTYETYPLPYTKETYDFNGDGIDDEVKIKNTYALAIILKGENGENKDTIELDLPSGYTLQADGFGRQRNPHVMDVDNNGMLDFVVIPQNFDFVGRFIYVIYLNEDWTFYCQDLPYQYYDDYYRTYHYESLLGYPFVDLNNDGTPDFKRGYFMKSRITNEAPAVPTNLRAVQESEGIYLYWDAAKDKETPAAQMRYNISVKKKGVAVGTDNAFIVSPMNGLYDEAAIIPGYYYPHGTSYFIPIDKLTGGQTYEFQIQSIDLWSAHSPMSAVYTFTVQPQVLISMPAQTCVNEPVTVAFTGTNNSGISWNFDGGVASQNTDGSYSVYWATEGVKTVKATLSGNTSSRVIYVQNAQKDLFFALPERVLSNSWTEVTLPAVYENLEHLAIRTSANCTGYVLPKKDSRIFQVCFKSTSTDDSEIGWVEFYQNDAFCGEMNTFRASTRIIGNGTAPVISLVMVDATTGKNMITWDTPANLPSYIDSIIIYKEEGKANNWVKQAKVPISAEQWIDQASDPSVKSNSYCIAYTSIYGGESPKSAAHKTPHLQTNYGLNGAINLYWTFYQGDVVDSYQILRGTSSSNMQVLATVAGDECTYTDNSPVENAYYAIAYSNAAFVNEWSYSAAANAPAYKALNSYGGTIRTGWSNIMEASASIQSMLATQLTILSMEKIYTLTPSRTTLHLYVEITPSNATFKQARWSIVSGHELATIYSNGLLVANTEGKNGTVRVRATAIDGSGVYAERDITVSGMTPIITYYTIRFLNWNGEVLQSSKVAEGEMPVYTGATPTRAGENQYTYTFTGWSPAIVAATANADYTAQYDAAAHYTIRFLNWDGTVLQSELLKEGAMPTYKGTTPTHAESDNYTYTFTGWKPEIVSVTANADYTAQYDSLAVQYYTIRFLNWDSTVLQTELLKVGTMPVYKGETPTKEETEYESYTFRTWTPMVHTVTGDADYVAIYYITYIPHYFIQFLNWDGTVLQKEHLRADVMPTYKKETPVRAENDYYTYTFKGWKPEIVPVVADVDYIAQYDSVAIPYYTIRFLNWDGTVLQSESLKVGTMPTYKGTTPVHGQDGYYFSGWTPTIVAASANADYTAVYKTCEDMHLAWMIQDDGRSMGGMQYTSSWNYEYFSGASVLGAKSATLLTPKVDLTNMTSIKLIFNHRYEGTMNPSECLTLLVCTDYKYSINDKWEELTIPSYSRSFEDVTVEVPSKYAKANTVFAFDYYTDDTNGRWQIRNVRLDASCVESVEPTYYTIRFLNYDGTELQSSQVEEGEMPVYTGATPVRAADEQYTYSFKGWSPAIVAATANADYTAQFTATEKPVVTTHTVTVLSNDQTMGSVTGSGVYEQGSNVTISAQPNTGYRFSCWDDGFIPSDAISATEASSIASALASYETTADTYTVVGYVTRAYGNYTNSYYLADTPDGQGQFVVYKANASANIGDHVMVTGILTNYRGTTPETTEGAILKQYPEYGANATRTITVNSDTTITAIFVPSEPVITTYTVTVLSNDQTMGTVTGSGVYEKGTTVNISAVPHPGYHFTYWDDELAPSDAISATEAIAIASALESNEITDVKYTIVGYVVAAYGNIVNSYYLADTPDGQGQFVVYKANASANIGDHVMVTGKLTNYRGTTPETTEGAILKQYPEYGANATRTITVNSDMTITAIFAPASGTDIQETEWQQKAVKIIREDKVFILRGGKLYTVTGQEVK